MLLGYLISDSFPVSRLIVLAAVVTAAMWVWRWVVTRFQHPTSSDESVPDDPRPLRWAAMSDWVSVGVAVFILAVVLGGAVFLSVRTYGYVDLGVVTITRMSSGLDDGSHLLMLNDRLQQDRAMIPGAAYPSSWHAANGAIMTALHPGLDIGGGSATAYLAAKSTWSLLLFYLVTRTGSWRQMCWVAGGGGAVPRWLMAELACTSRTSCFSATWKKGSSASCRCSLVCCSP